MVPHVLGRVHLVSRHLDDQRIAHVVAADRPRNSGRSARSNWSLTSTFLATSSWLNAELLRERAIDVDRQSGRIGNLEHVGVDDAGDRFADRAAIFRAIA